MLERRDVVLRDVLELHDPHVCVPGGVSREDLDGRQASPWEHMRFDEGSCRLLHVIGAIVDRDGLQKHHSVINEEVAARTEECREVSPSDGLDHLDRNQLVISARETPVVLEEHGDLPMESSFADARRHRRVLRFGDGGGCHLGPVSCRRMHRQRTPTATDLH